MILQHLTLRDFGLFSGRQVFDLAPVYRNGKSRPIVLFGGINGGGKTTLFDAIQLALYGPRARCSKRASLGYSDFLVQSIHQGVAPAEGAGVSLAFRYATDGQERDYEVRRTWQVHEDKLRESLVVYQDGLPNQSLSGSWPQLVEELIPLEISQLFFFDGEKLRTLAEDASSSAALGAAIQALLGLDIVDRLIADATVLQGRLAKQAGTPEHRARVDEWEADVRRLRSRLDALNIELGGLENRLERARMEQQAAEETFAAVGGLHWKARDDRQKRLAELASQAAELEAQLLALAAGELPLALVPDLLERVERQDRLERQASEGDIVRRLLTQRDRQLLETLREAHTPRSFLQLVEEHLAADRQARVPSAGVPQRLALSENARSSLRHLQEHRLAELVTQARALLDRLGQVVREREDLQRALTVTPAEADIGQVVDRLKAATQQRAVLDEQAGRLEAERAAVRAELAERENGLRQLWEGQVERQFEREDALRMVQLAGRTRETMQVFLRRATAQKIDRLSALITESFRYLLRKQTLVERVLIEPATFAVTLYDAAGLSLPRQRLSEGEKQIFAVALLWGLARASARPLPAVIDTPMARLDATHRQHLVERYFPHASHQVILFSTDTEVDRHHYEALQPAIARAYHLRYDEATRMTVGEEGYFWR
jgi:DNA sulfur modification protein DndD